MNPEPIIIPIDILDTDYAKMMAGEPIPEDRKRRLEAASPDTFEYLSKQISRYLYGNLNQEDKDDVLCNIGSAVELWTPSDLEDMNDRLRSTGHFYLTKSERLQIKNWLKDEFDIALDI